MHGRIPFNGGEYLSPHTCADAIEPVLLGLSAPLEIPALEDIATQLAVTSNQAMNVDPADNESAAAETGACRSSIEQIQHELHLASLRQVEIQKRIRAIRDALIALINVFGPEILNEQRNGSLASGKYVSRAEVASVCVQILRKSETEWLTAHQIMELIRKHRPLTL